MRSQHTRIPCSLPCPLHTRMVNPYNADPKQADSLQRAPVPCTRACEPQTWTPNRRIGVRVALSPAPAHCLPRRPRLGAESRHRARACATHGNETSAGLKEPRGPQTGATAGCRAPSLRPRRRQRPRLLWRPSARCSGPVDCRVEPLVCGHADQAPHALASARQNPELVTRQSPVTRGADGSQAPHSASQAASPGSQSCSPRGHP